MTKLSIGQTVRKIESNLLTNIQTKTALIPKTPYNKIFKIRSESSKTERPSRPSLPPSLIGTSSTNKAPELKRNSDLVRHSSELARTSEKRHSDLSRKHSDSSRHSERTLPDKPAVHSTNLGKPDKFSFAKPERPLMDKVVAKNENKLGLS